MIKASIGISGFYVEECEYTTRKKLNSDGICDEKFSVANSQHFATESYFRRKTKKLASKN